MIAQIDAYAQKLAQGRSEAVRQLVALGLKRSKERAHG